MNGINHLPSGHHPSKEKTAMKHDEDLLEQLFWEFDEQRKRSGDERMAFKGLCCINTPEAGNLGP